MAKIKKEKINLIGKEKPIGSNLIMEIMDFQIMKIAIIQMAQQTKIINQTIQQAQIIKQIIQQIKIINQMTQNKMQKIMKKIKIQI